MDEAVEYDEAPPTVKSPPWWQEKPAGFAERIMALPPDAGSKRLSTWQETHARDARFNARGCR